MQGLDENQLRDWFNRDLTRKDLEEAVRRSEEALGKVKGGFLQREFAKVKLLVMMLKDYFEGEYDKVPWHTIKMSALVVLYILRPIDLIPDFIPFVGQWDDLGVLLWFWGVASENIKEYARWKILQGDESVVELYERAFES